MGVQECNLQDQNLVCLKLGEGREEDKKSYPS